MPPDIHEDEDEVDKPLVRPASRKELAKAKRDLDTHDEDLLPLVPPRSPPAGPVRKRKGPSAWQGAAATLEHGVPEDSRERPDDTSILGRTAEGETLRNIISKLSEERNFKNFHLKHYHMSTAQFKKRTIHLDISGETYDFYQHVVKTSPRKDLAWADFGHKNLETSSFWTMDRQRLETKPSDFLMVLHEATSHLTAYPRKSTSPSEVIAKLHKWMDTIQMNLEAICADMACRQRIPTGPHTPWPNRAEMGVRLFRKFLLALVDTASKNLNQTTLAQITPAQLMRKAATVRNT